MPLPNQSTESARNKIILKQGIDFGSGVLSGVGCASLLHPWDRAIYLSIKHQRPFFMWANFSTPYHGVMQTAVQRAVIGSAYYYVQAQMRAYIVPYLRDNLGATESMQDFATGFAAGSAHGLMTNGIAAIKAHTWGDPTRTFGSSVREMYNASGYKAFFRGQKASLFRDTIHGSTYEVVRHKLQTVTQTSAFHDLMIEHPKLTSFVFNTAAACLGTILSSPFNYARTMQFSTPPHHTSPTIPDVLKRVWKESGAHAHKTLGRGGFFQDRFRIGIGTARGAVGMALGQEIFDRTRAFCNSAIEEDMPKLA